MNSPISSIMEFLEQGSTIFRLLPMQKQIVFGLSEKGFSCLMIESQSGSFLKFELYFERTYSKYPDVPEFF